MIEIPDISAFEGAIQFDLDAFQKSKTFCGPMFKLLAQVTSGGPLTLDSIARLRYLYEDALPVLRDQAVESHEYSQAFACNILCGEVCGYLAGLLASHGIDADPLMNPGTPEYDFLWTKLEGVARVAPVAKATLSPDTSGYLSSARLAEIHHVDPEALRKRLKRWRRNHDGGWIDTPSPGPNEPTVLYDAHAVDDVLKSLASRRPLLYVQRPAQKFYAERMPRIYRVSPH